MSISFQGMFEGKLAGKHERLLPSKPFCIVQTQWQVSGGLWLSVLLRLQIWLCPDGLISQKHRTVALEQAASGKSEIDWEGVNTSKLHQWEIWSAPISLKDYHKTREQQSLVYIPSSPNARLRQPEQRP